MLTLTLLPISVLVIVDFPFSSCQSFLLLSRFLQSCNLDTFVIVLKLFFYLNLRFLGTPNLS